MISSQVYNMWDWQAYLHLFKGTLKILFWMQWYCLTYCIMFLVLLLKWYKNMGCIADLLKQPGHVFAIATKLVKDIIESNCYDTSVIYLGNKSMLWSSKNSEWWNLQFPTHKISVPIWRYWHQLDTFQNVHTIRYSNL